MPTVGTHQAQFLATLEGCVPIGWFGVGATLEQGIVEARSGERPPGGVLYT